MRQFTSAIATAVGLGVVLSIATIHAEEQLSEFEQLAMVADVIAIVEIRSADYTATATGGPMYGEAKVLKVIKGKLSKWRLVRFGASAWVGPTYQKGELRIIFLQQVADEQEYYQQVRWSSLDAGRVDLFVVRGLLERCSEASLLESLRGIRAPSFPPPVLEFICAW